MAAKKTVKKQKTAAKAAVTTGRNAKGQFVKGNKESVGNEGGRESKYKPEFCQGIIEFFLQPPTQVLYREDYFQNGKLKRRIPMPLPAEYPTFELYAAKCGVTAKTMLEWSKKYPEFGEAYARAKDIQRGIMLTNGMRGMYNPMFAKFEAVNNHNMRDKIETSSTVAVTTDTDAQKALEALGYVKSD